MRKWVEYDFDEDRVSRLNKKRLLKSALALQQAFKDFEGQKGIRGIVQFYTPYLDAALNGKINYPIMDRLPYTAEIHERQLPEEFHSILNRFCDALESKPAVYAILDNDTFFHHKEKYIKEENGKTYILEHFEDDEIE